MKFLKSAAAALLLTLTTLVCAAPAAAQIVEYIHTDALGSVVAVTDANRNIVERREYEPYGYQLSPTLQNGPGYTGHVQDAATGLTYMQQRYYDPVLGRFLSVDPVTMHDTGDPRHFNRYGYANNNPYAYVDPDGNEGKVAWLVRLTSDGMKRVARLTREQAVRARRNEENIVADRRQISSQIETAAHGRDGQLRHAGHELDGGGKGLPHYQTEGVRGHSFWGKVSVGVAAIAGTLEQVADAAEYIPDPIPRPAEQSDIDRTNRVLGAISEATGLSMPTLKLPQDEGFQGVFQVRGRIDSIRMDRQGGGGR